MPQIQAHSPHLVCHLVIHVRFNFNQETHDQKQVSSVGIDKRKIVSYSNIHIWYVPIVIDMGFKFNTNTVT